MSCEEWQNPGGRQREERPGLRHDRGTETPNNEMLKSDTEDGVQEGAII